MTRLTLGHTHAFICLGLPKRLETTRGGGHVLTCVVVFRASSGHSLHARLCTARRQGDFEINPQANLEQRLHAPGCPASLPNHRV